jgi:uncharacterized BrkB/YihY/UPF0761 family membrane protein
MTVDTLTFYFILSMADLLMLTLAIYGLYRIW